MTAVIKTFQDFLNEKVDNVEVYYFAYGSNMYLPQMDKRLKHNYTKIGIGLLKGYTFVYNKLSKDGTGKANIIRDSGDKVLGVVYKMPNSSLQILNKFEKGYSPVYLDVYYKNEKIKCITYLADKHNNSLMPTKAYKNTILTYAIAAKLPRDYINYMQNFETVD